MGLMPPTPASDSSKRLISDPSESREPSKLAKLSEDRADVKGAGEEAPEEALEPETPGMSQNPRVQRYLVAVEYIGTGFFGSQKQPNCRTVTGSVEDSGVHALSNVFHVDIERTSKRKPNEVLPPHEPGVVRRAINHFLQREGDITVTEVQFVPANFHSRYMALERTYFYRLLSGPDPLPVFEKDRAWHVAEELDALAMKKACDILAGHHDFSSFRAAGCQATSPFRTLDELSVSEVAPFLCFPSISERRDMSFKSSSGSSSSSNVALRKCSNESIGIFGERRRHRCFVITSRSRSFLYHQVRLLVGVLKSVGTGELTIEDVKRILSAKNVAAASPMAPACGLYLGNIKYSFSEL
ncbi:hypothetical protein KSP39_PZI010007 [Platanthera zijinensis]|uniref:tRNA pseudouridine synthase n=1 Tax=Platanthera zijinensis TaxID=2320716 RepID=A0AAP0BJN2_9ASPA